MRKSTIFSHIIRYGIIIFLAVIWLIPIYISIVTPFKSIMEIFTKVLSLPESWSFNSFIKVCKEVDILRYLKNSVIITGGACILLAFLASLAAYAISRSSSRILKSTYLIFTFGLMIPTQACMIALFDVMNNLHLYNTAAGMIFAYLGCSLPVSIFLFYGFFKAIPYDIIESAYIDGCGEFKIYFNIVMPLSTSAAGTVIIYNCVNTWKDFTYPLIFTQGEKVKTLPIAIYAMKGQYVSDYPSIFAGVLLSSLPLLIVYILLQKQFIAGITAGAVKG